MKKIFLIIALQLIFLPSVCAEAFQDVSKDDMYYSAVTYFASKGVIEGYDAGDGKRIFKPEQLVNRAEAVKMVLAGAVNSFSAPEDVLKKATFSDVPKEAWYAKYVQLAKTYNIISGDGDTGKFAGTRNVNKAELLKMTLLANDIPLESKLQDASAYVAPDVNPDHWFYSYLRFAKEYGVIYPDTSGNLYPAKALTRGEVALYMYNIVKNIRLGEAQELLSRTEAKLLSAITFANRNDFTSAQRDVEKAKDLVGEAVEKYGDNTVVVEAHTITLAYADILEAHKLLRESKPEEATVLLKKGRDRMSNVSTLLSLKSAIEKMADDIANDL